ncbi:MULTISPECIES: hypothetical protein [unclassified Nocardia]|uniref:hypothetical protein n=1 Tax=unclassified Nocardia TaxID=2637762 RepID=UPI001CE49D1C|nr:MULTISPECIES: hypothetical protein [unclassified Nocardia]
MIENDDLLHRVDAHWLGPAGQTLPMRIRYQAAGVGTLVFITVFVISRAVLHLGLGFRTLLVMAALTVVITSRVTRYINADRPLRSVIRAAWNDLTAPRPPKPGRAVSIQLPAPTRRRRGADSSPDFASTPTEGEFR